MGWMRGNKLKFNLHKSKVLLLRFVIWKLDCQLVFNRIVLPLKGQVCSFSMLDLKVIFLLMQVIHLKELFKVGMQLLEGNYLLNRQQ